MPGGEQRSLNTKAFRIFESAVWNQWGRAAAKEQQDAWGRFYLGDSPADGDAIVLGGYVCSGAGGSRFTNASPGAGIMHHSTIAAPGSKFGWVSSEAISTVEHAVADVTNPRIDLVVVALTTVDPVDSQFDVKIHPNDGGGVDLGLATQKGSLATLEIVAGTPAASPVPPAVPTDKMLLCQVTIPANENDASNYTYDDRRPRGSGSRFDLPFDMLDGGSPGLETLVNTYDFLGGTIKDSFGVDTLRGGTFYFAWLAGRAFETLVPFRPLMAPGNGQGPTYWMMESAIGRMGVATNRAMPITTHQLNTPTVDNIHTERREYAEGHGNSPGTSPQTISIEFIDPGGAGSLSVRIESSADGNSLAVKVTSAHNGANPTSTMQEIIDAVNASGVPVWCTHTGDDVGNTVDPGASGWATTTPVPERAIHYESTTSFLIDFLPIPGVDTNEFVFCTLPYPHRGSGSGFGTPTRVRRLAFTFENFISAGDALSEIAISATLREIGGGNTALLAAPNTDWDLQDGNRTRLVIDLDGDGPIMVPGDVIEITLSLDLKASSGTFRTGIRTVETELEEQAIP